MRRPTSQAHHGPPCPADADHGPLLAGPGTPGKSFYCPHQAHDGRPKTHPLGAAPATRPYFGIDEINHDG